MLRQDQTISIITYLVLFGNHHIVMPRFHCARDDYTSCTSPLVLFQVWQVTARPSFTKNVGGLHQMRHGMRPASGSKVRFEVVIFLGIYDVIAQRL